MNSASNGPAVVQLLVKGLKRLSRFLLPALLIGLIICPLLTILLRALVRDGHLALNQALTELLTSQHAQMIGNSLLLAALVVIVSTILAAPIAYFMTRSSLARHHWLDIILLIPFMTPPYIGAMGWILFMQKRGLLQQLLPGAAGLETCFFSLGGLVLVMSLHVFPFMLTMLKNALLNLPSGFEEAAAISGAGFGRRLRKVVLPLLSGNYAIGALLVFVKTLSEYGTPATLGQRIGFEVFTTDIHRYATVAPVDFAQAANLSFALIGICLILWMLQSWISRRHQYQLVGSGVRAQSQRGLSRRGTVFAWIYLSLVLLLAIGIPYFSILTTSFIKLRGYGLRAGNFTWQHYQDLFTANTKGRQALINSVGLALSSATLASILGTAIVLRLRRKPSGGRVDRGGRLLEATALLPEMLPGIVLVIGIMLFWNDLYRVIPLYNTLGIMVLAYTVLFLPYSVQYVSSAYSQLSPSLLAAASVAGGRPAYVLRRITLPLLFKGILSGWMMIFMIAFRELVTASLIAPPDTLVVSTYILREFEQGSVSLGMAMAVLCVLFTTGSLLLLNRLLKPAGHRRS
ncbi:iron ABC transporter permease [Oscillospiraceae bacterium HV4-5-C5C]|nr:iron ABC transporter permease [Oscillospiraceae bacterium HV4-5-C5C]